ncbi:hypothetical protein [Actimicrobium antarcticum]|uniref:Autotransporter domain-containing protein n=1 Tax=Actimicrobium antarcticum TaxID=1051899 RepID=A0ABP7SX57_9BURK
MQRLILQNVMALGVLASSSAMAQQALSGDPRGTLWQPPGPVWQAYAEISAWAAYDAIPVEKFGGKWGEGYAPRAGRNVFLQRERASVGVEKDGWRVGLEYRQEGSLDASRDTVDFYHLYQQRQRPDGARAFNLDAQFKSWSATGVRVAKTFSFDQAGVNGLLVTVSGALYGTTRNRDTDVGGTASYQTSGTYGFDAHLLESNTRYRYPFMPDTSRTSSGASLSLALQMPLNERFSVNLAVDDLWSRLRWSNLPLVQKNISSSFIGTDSNGYVNYQPLLSGQNTLISKTGAIGASQSASLSYHDDQWRFKLGADRVAATTIPSASVTWQSAVGAFTAGYETRFGTVGLGYGDGPFYVQVRANRWSLSQATSLGASAGFQTTF